MKSVHLISIGDELLLGQVVNTNAAWIAKKLFFLGFEVKKVTEISDSKEDIIEMLDYSKGKYDVIILTGGLGPTNDDITKQTLSEYFGKKLILNEDALNLIRKVVKERGAKMNTLNEKQAMLPEGIKLIENKNGTAWGMIFEKDNMVVISLPGVPLEMKPMFEEGVVPFLKEKFKTPYFRCKTIYIKEIPESELAIMIKDWEKNLPFHIKLAYLPQQKRIRLRLSGFGYSEKELQMEIDKQIDKLREFLGKDIKVYEDIPVEQNLGKVLRENNFTVSTAESCTGGYIAHLITSVSGASDYYKGSIVSYSNEAKINVLGVNAKDIEVYGAVSSPVVKQMAEGVKKLIKTDFSVAVSGIAGPKGGTPQKPVGTTYIAVSTPLETISKKFIFKGDRASNIKQTANQALTMLLDEIVNNYLKK